MDPYMYRKRVASTPLPGGRAKHSNIAAARMRSNLLCQASGLSPRGKRREDAERERTSLLRRRFQSWLAYEAVGISRAEPSSALDWLRLQSHFCSVSVNGIVLTPS